jgi:hypothetical protein
MIRPSLPSDTDEIARLGVTQLRRTPYINVDPAPITGWRVRTDHYSLSGCYSYFAGDLLFVTQLWVDDGFAGWRAAVELSHDAEMFAERLGISLCFEIGKENSAYQRAVATAGYVPIVEGAEGLIYGRWTDQPGSG